MPLLLGVGGRGVGGRQRGREWRCIKSLVEGRADMIVRAAAEAEGSLC